MRANEFLVEVEMTPNALRREASKINAMAGCEFEMYVPGAAGPDEDAESEADYEQDESANDIDDIINFFNAGDMNGRRDLARLRDELTEAYDEYVMNEQDEQWYEEGKALLREYIEENDWDEDEVIADAMDSMGLSDEEKDAARAAGEGASGITSSKNLPKTREYDHWNRAGTLAEGALDVIVEDEWRKQGDIYEKVKDEWYNDQEAPDQRDFLRSNNIRKMSDVESSYDIAWPHWTSAPEGEVSIEDVAEQFKDMIGREVNYGEYHSSERGPNTYNIETDGSLRSPDDSDDGGLEFISPPLPMAEMISDLNKVKSWADSTGCYTNDSTGLHINVSLESSPSPVDYVKLAILLGDQYILDSFGRAGNHYCKSAMKNIVDRVSTSQADAKVMLDKMRAGLDALASKLIHSGNTDKFVSINNKGNYIEFRSPGADWLGENFDKIENTLYRTVVALDAASDPTKYRKEYLRKLETVLTGGKNVKYYDPTNPANAKQPTVFTDKGRGVVPVVTTKNDPLKIFAQYMAGELTTMGLKGFIKEIQAKRAESKTQQANTTNDTSSMVTRVRQPLWDLSRADLPHVYQARGRTPAAARLDVRRAYPTIFPDSLPDEEIIVRASPESATQPPTDTSDRLFLWTMYDINTDQPVGTPFRAITSGDAGRVAIEQMDGYGMPLDRRSVIGVRRVRATDQDPEQTPSPEETPAPQRAARRMWSIIDRNSGEHLTSFEADNHADALLQGTQWCNDNDIAQETRRNLIVDTTE